MCIATHIMEMTRSLTKYQKAAMKQYLNEIIVIQSKKLKKWEKENQCDYLKLVEIKQLKDRKIDLTAVKKVSGLQFNQMSEDWLLSLFNDSVKD